MKESKFKGMNKTIIQIIIVICSLFGLYSCETNPRIKTILYFDPSLTHNKILLFGNYGKEKWGLFVSDLDKKECKLLTQTNYCMSPPVWSSSGEYIVYDTPNGLFRIREIDCQISQITDITGRKIIWDSYPKWSPQGDKIAFVRCFEEREEEIKELIPEGYTDLWIVDLEKKPLG